MKPIFYIALGAMLVGVAWLAVLVVKHGWGWVLAKLKARAARLEADAKAKTDAITAPILGRLAKVEGELAAIKIRLNTPATPPTAAQSEPASPSTAGKVG